MDEQLQAHLATLPAPQLARVAKAVLGLPLQTPSKTIEALARQLHDAEWVRRTMKALGPGAQAALAAVVSAGVPVLRKDVSALVADRNVDPVDLLEEHGLVYAVRTGRGMPTHVALTPGLAEIVGRSIQQEVGTAGSDSTFMGHRRRFDLALMLAVTARYPPRLTRAGRLHAGDLGRLATHLSPLGLRGPALEKHLARWLDTGVAIEKSGALRLNAGAFHDVRQLFVTLALAELAAPSVPDGSLRIVERLVRSGGTIELRAALEVAQAELLRSRTDTPDGPSRGARTELLEIARSLLSLDALLLQDKDGHPLVIDEPDALALGSSPRLALEPSVAAALRNEPLPAERFHSGHVQSSFEIVADSGCDPTLVARLAVWAELVRADRAVVLRLERASVQGAIALGFDTARLLSDLEALSGRKPPPNVVVLVNDWVASAQITEPLAEAPIVEMEGMARAARTAVLGATES